MKKLTLLLLITLSHWVTISVQDIQSWINSKKPVLFEKLYLQVDRELYAKGDIIWLKAYQVNGITHQLNSNFRNIFVQLVAEDGRVVKDLILFSVKGEANGSFKTDSLADGIYTIRAFTKYLENFGEEAYFHKKIWISGSLNTVKTGNNGPSELSKIEVAFLPEGGNMVLNTANTVAFKAIDEKGRGVSISGKILDDLGDTITFFSTSYLGMGKFLMMPVDDRTYYATIDRYPELKIKLEPASADGIAMNYKEKGNLLRFVLSSNMKLNFRRSFYFVASYKGIVLFHSRIEMKDFTQLLDLSKSQFPKGISKITLLDSTLNQFAERLIFVGDGNDDLINLKLNKAEFKPREEVTIGAEALLTSDDSITSTLSVAVVNKNYFGSGGNSQNIKSYLLLDSDLKGSIESPASYFVNDEANLSEEKLDLLMLVNGWRFYFWDSIEANKTASLGDWNDVGFEVKGYVKKLLWEVPQANAEVVIGTARGNFVIDSTTTNEQGRFKFERICLLDSVKMMLNAKTKNGTRNTEIRLDSEKKMDSEASADSLKNVCFDISINTNFNRDNSFRRLKEFGFNPENGTILLEGISVVENKKPKNDGHYRIYSDPDNSLTITKEDASYMNVLDYLEGKVAGLTMSGDVISIRGGGPPLFLVDGFEPIGGVVEVMHISMREIDKVEVIKSAGNLALFGTKGANGVISIFRKTASQIASGNINTYEKGRTDLNMRGFHKPQKFYSPSYTLYNKNNPKPDYRPTLFWNPDLKFENGKANFDFYTSDEQSQYVVTVEGISKKGKICFGTTQFKVNRN